MVAIQRSLDQSVGRVLRQIFVLMGGIVVVAFVAWLVFGQFLLARVDTVYEDRVIPLRDLSRVGHIVNVQIPQRYMDGGYEGDAAGPELQADWDQIETLWQRYLLTYLTPEETTLAAQARQSLDELRKHLFETGLRDSLGYGNDGAIYLQALRTFNERFVALHDLQVEVALQNLQQARTVTHWAVVAAALLALAMVLLAVFAHQVIGQRVLAPLEWVARSLERMAGGDVTRQSPRFALSAEFSELLDQVERVRHSVAERQHLLVEEQRISQRLRDTQAELVEAEKLASLGSLVAGVAHELNTPIGIAVAVASGLEEKRKAFVAAMAQGLRRSALDGLLADLQQAGQLLGQNLDRAAALVRSFKQVAVDRAGTQRRAFDMGQTVDEILVSLRPSLRGQGIALVNRIPGDITLDSYPGPFGQVVTNLVNNAALHAFPAGSPPPADGPRVVLEHMGERDGQVWLRVSDNGVGMSEQTLSRIYEPFFTTRLGQGGSGLGMSIVRNIVIGLLGGRLQVHSVPGQGTTVDIHLPRQAPGHQAHVSQESVIYAVR